MSANITCDLREFAFAAHGERFGTIVVDPPWRYGSDVAKALKRPHEAHQRGVQAGRVYQGTLSIGDIAALRVGDFAREQAHLYLWVTNGILVHPASPVQQVCAAWGFRAITVVTWAKHHRGAPSRPSMKTGFYFRGASEHLVFAVKGPAVKINGTVPTWFAHPRIGRHSAKPDWCYEQIKDWSPGPHVELFARGGRDGWTTIGNEATALYARPAHEPPQGRHHRGHGQAARDRHSETDRRGRADASRGAQGAGAGVSEIPPAPDRGDTRSDS